MNIELVKKVVIIIVIIFLLIELTKIPLPTRIINENYDNNKSNNKKSKRIEEFLNNNNTGNHNKQNLKNSNNYKNKIKRKLNYHKSLINYLSSNYSQKLFKNIDYLNNMNSINVKSRKFNNLEELKLKYINDSLDDITNEEKDAFFWMIQNLIIKGNKLTPFIYKSIFIDKVKIAKSKSWLEYNMPHTHKDVIILTNEWFKSLINKKKENLIMSALLNEGSTFCHELMHVHQRDYLNRYENLYYKWGFIKGSYIHNCFDYFNKNRHNPDGQYLNWIWKNNDKYFLFGAIFNNNNPSNLSDVSYSIREIKKTDNNIFNYSGDFDKYPNNSLFNHKGFMNYFGIINNHYHPNEIASQYFEYYLNDNLGEKDNFNPKGYKIFLKNIEYILYGKKQ